MTKRNKGASLKWAVVSVLAIIAIISIPVGVAQANDFLIGASEPVQRADNIETGTYTYYDNTGTQQTSSVSYIVDNGVIDIYISDVAVDDGYEDYLTVKISQPTASYLVDSEIVELYSEAELSDNYENLEYSMDYDGSNGTLDIFDNEIDGSQGSELVEISTDYAYLIQSETGENAQPVVRIGTSADDNQVLTNQTLSVKSWAFASTSVVHATHSTVWKMSMLAMGLASFILAIFATNVFDVRVNV